MKNLALRPCLCLLLLLQGCGGAPYDNPSTITLGSHKVSVQPGCMSKQINNRFPGKDEIYNLTCGETRITIRNEELIVNDKSYGVLNKGDAVHVEGERVFVNSREVREAARG
jgi:hypothetical protein